MSKRMSDEKKHVRITVVRSPIGYSEKQKRTIRALGLRRLGDSVRQEDTPVIRGMIFKVSHLVRVEDLSS